MAMATYYNPRIVTNGLVLYLDAANRKCVAGPEITDGDMLNLAPVNTGRISLSGGSGTYNPNFNGGAIVLNGASNHYVQTTGGGLESTVDFASGGFTINTAFRATSYVFNQVLLGKGSSSYKITRNGSLNSFNFTTAGLSEVNTTSTTTFSLLANYILTCVYTGSQKIIYVNGVVDKTSSVTGTLTTNNDELYWGSEGAFTSSSWDGRVYFLQMYNRALSAQEVYDNFAAMKGRFNL